MDSAFREGSRCEEMNAKEKEEIKRIVENKREKVVVVLGAISDKDENEYESLLLAEKS